MDVGRIKLLPARYQHPRERASRRTATSPSQLYGGDNDTRIRQEIVLGIGGMRALEAMGLKPTVYHMNEGPLGLSGARAHPRCSCEQHRL